MTPMSRSSRSRAVSRLVAVVCAAAVALVAAGPAEAGKRKPKKAPPYVAPTSLTYVGATCYQVDEYSHEIFLHYKASGGTYRNHGSSYFGTEIHGRPLVRGGSRIVDMKISVYGWWVEGDDPTTDARTRPVEVVHTTSRIPRHKHRIRGMRTTRFTDHPEITCTRLIAQF